MKKILKWFFLFTLPSSFIYVFYLMQSKYAVEYYELYIQSERNFFISDSILKDRLENNKMLLAKLTNNNLEIIKTPRGYSVYDNGHLMNKIDASVAHLLSLELDSKIKKIDGSPDDFIKERYSKQLKEQNDMIISTLSQNNGIIRDLNLRKELLKLDDFEYFSWVSGTSTGYGDIFPLSSTARLIVKRQVIMSLIILSLITSGIFNLFTELSRKLFEA